MDSDSIGLILIIIGLIVMSAYFSATETAYSSCNRVRLKNTAAGGNRRAKLALTLSEDFDRMLSTILIGNNIVNIASASLATVVFVKWFGDAGLTISTVSMTILVLIFGEISPKSLAKEMPERFAIFSAPILRVFLWILAPVNFLFVQWKKLLSKLFRVKNDRTITEEELLTLVDEAQQEGGINAQEGELIRSAIEFDDVRADNILVPRVDITAVPCTADKDALCQIFRETGFSRLPVYRDSLDDIVGVIHQKDFYNEVVCEGNSIQSIIKPAIFIAPAAKISRVLKLLQQAKSHMAIVTDEFGGTAGILTLEDILEELVGEIWDEHDEMVGGIEKLTENAYRILGSVELEDLPAWFPCGEQGEAATVGGWVMERFERIPNEGDSFVNDNLSITVTKMDYQRVVEITAEILAPAEVTSTSCG